MTLPDPRSLYLTWAMRPNLTRYAWFALALSLILGACSNDPERVNFAYLRSPSFFRADTAATDHPLCDQPGSPFASEEECRTSRKYKLSWLRPEDTANLVGYRIYLDTVTEEMKWNTMKERSELASVIVRRHPLKDSLIFVFTHTKPAQQDTLSKEKQRIFALDSNDREEEGNGRLVFSLVPIYEKNVTPGQPQFAFFKTTDKEAPDVFRADYKPLARGVSAAWGRPTDRVSFFNPSQDTGIIAGYRLELGLGGRHTPERMTAFKPVLKSYRVGDSDRTAEVTDSAVSKNSLPDRVFYRLPDMHRSSKRTTPIAADSMHLEIGGLLPRDTITLRLFALDSAGNSNLNSMEKITLHTTDTTQPSRPRLSIADSLLTQNGFTVSWSASRDSIPGPDGTLTVSPDRHRNIQAYRLSRTLLRAPGEKITSLDRVDTVLTMDTVLAKLDPVRVPVAFLPPGTAFSLRVQAEDSSGFLSLPDTLTVSTRKVMFAGADSALVCPSGFIPMPRAQFKLGDSTSTGQDSARKDELPQKLMHMGPFCIEPYEHRDSTGKRFVNNVSYDQARAICRSIDSTFATDLCSEAEWERACEGSNPASPLTHGIQSQRNNPSILQTSCNQGTSDSAMAMTFALRNSICLTTEGVYDMAGNLSEWVRDPYVENAYNLLSAKDSLDHGFTFADPLASGSRGLRGGNYLKPNISQVAEVQKLARCSNRDFPQQVRPKFRKECVDADSQKVAIIYGSGRDWHRCIEVPPILRGLEITEITPDARDTSGLTMLAFAKNKPEPLSFKVESTDTAFKGRKPLSAKLTTRSLAAVVFERIADPTESAPDTLDATEMRDTTQAGLAKIFAREAGNSGWAVRKQDGRFEIRYLFGYAYEIRGTVPAQKFYSSRAIGFRCCSRAK